MIRTTRQVAALATLIVAMGCSTEPNTDLPEGAVAFQPAATYASWWQATEACSQRSGDYRTIEWYVVPGASTFQTDAGEKVGLRIQSGDKIRIVLAESYAQHEMVVRHEMLHALLRQGGHPPEYFEQKCRLTWSTWQADHGAQATAELS